MCIISINSNTTCPLFGSFTFTITKEQCFLCAVFAFDNNPSEANITSKRFISDAISSNNRLSEWTMMNNEFYFDFESFGFSDGKMCPYVSIPRPMCICCILNTADKTHAHILTSVITNRNACGKLRGEIIVSIDSHIGDVDSNNNETPFNIIPDHQWCLWVRAEKRCGVKSTRLYSKFSVWCFWSIEKRIGKTYFKWYNENSHQKTNSLNHHCPHVQSFVPSTKFQNIDKCFSTFSVRNETRRCFYLRRESISMNLRMCVCAIFAVEFTQNENIWNTENVASTQQHFVRIFWQKSHKPQCNWCNRSSYMPNIQFFVCVHFNFIPQNAFSFGGKSNATDFYRIRISKFEKLKPSDVSKMHQKGSKRKKSSHEFPCYLTHVAACTIFAFR